MASAAATGRPPRRRRRALVAVIVLGVLVLLLVVAVFVADASLRSYAEERIRAEIRDGLPSGATGDMNVDVGGGLFLLQYLRGSLDRVELAAPDFALNGVPLGFRAVATGVPVDRSQPIEKMVGTVRLSEGAVNDLVAQSGLSNAPAEIRLRNGEVGYASSFRFLGFDLDYDVTAEPRIDGDTVILTPTDAELTSVPGGLNIGGVLGDNLSRFAVPVCVAQFLPEGVTITGLEVTTGRLVATFAATDLVLSEQTLTSSGSCSDS